MSCGAWATPFLIVVIWYPVMADPLVFGAVQDSAAMPLPGVAEAVGGAAAVPTTTEADDGD